MTLIDFKCDTCGYVWEHLFRQKKEICSALPCPQCNRAAASEPPVMARRVWVNNNFIHPTHSAQYGKYEPCFGEVVTDYAHKKQLLKKYGVIEASDPTGGSRCYIEPDRQQRARKNLARWVETGELR